MKNKISKQERERLDNKLVFGDIKTVIKHVNNLVSVYRNKNITAFYTAFVSG